MSLQPAAGAWLVAWWPGSGLACLLQGKCERKRPRLVCLSYRQPVNLPFSCFLFPFFFFFFSGPPGLLPRALRISYPSSFFPAFGSVGCFLELAGFRWPTHCLPTNTWPRRNPLNRQLTSPLVFAQLYRYEPQPTIASSSYSPYSSPSQPPWDLVAHLAPPYARPTHALRTESSLRPRGHPHHNHTTAVAIRLLRGLFSCTPARLLHVSAPHWLPWAACISPRNMSFNCSHRIADSRLQIPYPPCIAHDRPFSPISS